MIVCQDVQACITLSEWLKKVRLYPGMDKSTVGTGEEECPAVVLSTYLGYLTSLYIALFSVCIVLHLHDGILTTTASGKYYLHVALGEPRREACLWPLGGFEAKMQFKLGKS